jgi:hypothetical protein
VKELKKIQSSARSGILSAMKKGQDGLHQFDIWQSNNPWLQGTKQMV